MKLSIAVLAASFAVGLSVQATGLLAQSAERQREDASALLPSGVKIDQFAVAADGKRTYFTNSAGELSLYVPADHTTSRVGVGPVWDLDLSRAGNVLVYTKGGPDRGDRHVYVLRLDPATGLGRGEERQVSKSSSDVPSISPDGTSVAFGRDDQNGVGQTLVVVPIGGGTERAVAPSRPSSLTSIRWTPDGKAIYFGVNTPVACVPGWSCLPLAPELRDPPGAIERVAASGGSIATVAPTRNARPGLSPDGRTLLYLDAAASTPRQWTVANADGTQRETLTLRTNENPVGWLRGSIVLLQVMTPGGRGGGDTSNAPSLVSVDLAASHSQQR